MTNLLQQKVFDLEGNVLEEDVDDDTLFECAKSIRETLKESMKAFELEKKLLHSDSEKQRDV